MNTFAAYDAGRYVVPVGPYKGSTLAEAAATDLGLLYLDHLRGEPLALLNVHLGTALRAFLREHEERLKALVLSGRTWGPRGKTGGWKGPPLKARPCPERTGSALPRHQAPRIKRTPAQRAIVRRLVEVARGRRGITAGEMAKRYRAGKLAGKWLDDMAELSRGLAAGDPLRMEAP